MADSTSMTPADLASKVLCSAHGDFLREAVQAVLRDIMEGEVTELAGAGLHERSDDRLAQRNGYRPRTFDTRVGTLELEIPRLRRGSYFPSFLEPRRRSEQALVAVVAEAYVNGVSTRKIERLAEQLGIESMSRSTVSRLCRVLDEQVRIFRTRPLEGRYPYLWLDARVEKVRENGSVRQKALVVAYGVHETGRREILGTDVGEAESEAFWREFVRSLVARGLSGVLLCVSDAHVGLKKAIAQVLGCPWQRCTVHFLRDMQGHVGKSQQQMVAAAVRQVFQAEDPGQARLVLAEVVGRLAPAVPKVARLLEEAEEDLLAFMGFPREHWSKLRSTNPLERINREIGRRSDVVGIYPNDESLLRLSGALLLEQTDEWLVSRRYLSAESLAKLYPEETATPVTVRAQRREALLVTT
jgi:transposase-like protein